MVSCSHSIMLVRVSCTCTHFLAHSCICALTLLLTLEQACAHSLSHTSSFAPSSPAPRLVLLDAFSFFLIALSRSLCMLARSLLVVFPRTYVCVRARVRVHVRVRVHLHVRACECVRAYVCVRACVRACMCACVSACV